jgi:hypothetical protein
MSITYNHAISLNFTVVTDLDRDKLYEPEHQRLLVDAAQSRLNAIADQTTSNGTSPIVGAFEIYDTYEE